MNKLTNLTFYGFYDPSKDMVMVHFFNSKESKPDIVAYLNNKQWDVREIVSETAHLYDHTEVINIRHNPLCKEDMGSKFDEFVRKGLYAMAKETHGEDVDLPKLDKMFAILEECK